jgi:FKBP-type peptidyl-prolyl cis-trans isomerase
MRRSPAVILALSAVVAARSLKAQDSTPARPTLAASLEIDTAKLMMTPSGLGILDVKVGDGMTAEPGKKVIVHYTLWNPSGEKRESSRDREKPFRFALGAGRVIRGWEEGVKGMKVGGRRKLVVPPGLAYKKGTLVFDIELLEVE